MTSPRPRPRGSSIVCVLSVALLVLTACSATPPGQDARNAPPTHRLRIGLVEWKIATSSTALIAGTDRLTVTNAGTTAHDLHVIAPGLHAHTPLLAPGESTTITVETKPGETLQLTCEVPGHEDAGMHTTIAVERAARSR